MMSMNRKMHGILTVVAAAGMLWLNLSAAGVEQTPAGGAGMDAVDVLHLVDGTEVVGKLTAFDGAKFTVEVQGEAKQISRAEVVRIAFGQPQPRPKLLYVGSDTDDLANTFVAEALEKAGFDLTPAPRLPAALDGFDVVVLESVSASSPEAAKMLRSFVGKGGGAVLVGFVPIALCPEGKRSAYYDDQGIDIYPWDTSAVADWIGGATMEAPEKPLSDPRCTASLANPFFACPDIPVGQELYVFRGERTVNFFTTGSLSAQARPVAKIRFERKNIDRKMVECTHVAAFAHPFGQGRTYYQFMSYEPNHPKLVDLLVAAAKWTAGVLPEVSG
jgi:hypothetical protein